MYIIFFPVIYLFIFASKSVLSTLYWVWLKFLPKLYNNNNNNNNIKHLQ